MKLKFLLPLLCGVSFLAAAQQVSLSAGNFVVEKNVAVPMRDGVVLRADVLRGDPFGQRPRGRQIVQPGFQLDVSHKLYRSTLPSRTVTCLAIRCCARCSGM